MTNLLINAWRSAEAAGGPIFFKPDRGSSSYAREPKGKEGKAGKGSQFGGHEFLRVTSVESESNKTLQNHTNSVESCPESASHHNLRLQESTPRPHLQLFGSMSSKHLRLSSKSCLFDDNDIFQMVPDSGNSIRSGSRPNPKK